MGPLPSSSQPNPSPSRRPPLPCPLRRSALRGRQEVSESRRWPSSTLPVPIFTASGTTRSNQATLQRQRLIPDNPLAKSDLSRCPDLSHRRRREAGKPASRWSGGLATPSFHECCFYCF